VFGEAHFRDSALYDADFAHVLRNKGKKKIGSKSGSGFVNTPGVTPQS
jgi:hypothetical protein